MSGGTKDDDVSLTDCKWCSTDDNRPFANLPGGITLFPPPLPWLAPSLACSGRREFQMFLTGSSQWPLSQERSAVPPVPRCLFPSDLEVWRRDTFFRWAECEMPVCQIGSALRCAARHRRPTLPHTAHLATVGRRNLPCSRFCAIKTGHQWNVVRYQHLKNNFKKEKKIFPGSEMKNDPYFVTSQRALMPECQHLKLPCFGSYKHTDGPTTL